MVGVLQCVLIQKGVGKTMVMDRQKVKTRSESRRYRVADRLVVKVQKQARVKTRRTRKRRNAKSRRTGKPLVDLETCKTNWHRDTGNTGINTVGTIIGTWKGWRQSQGQVKQIRA
jgi:hypothetical protein